MCILKVSILVNLVLTLRFKYKKLLVENLNCTTKSSDVIYRDHFIILRVLFTLHSSLLNFAQIETKSYNELTANCKLVNTTHAGFHYTKD
jgi:hypothetical protein